MCGKSLETLKKVKSLISKICFQTGLNTAIDYDGIETEKDIIIYLEAILENIKQKGILFL